MRRTESKIERETATCCRVASTRRLGLLDVPAVGGSMLARSWAVRLHVAKGSRARGSAKTALAGEE